MAQYVIPILIGTAFGFALSKGGLTRYGNIVGVFRFTNLTVIKFMLSGMVTAMIGVYALKGFGLVDFPNIPATYVLGNVVGGLIFGIGMSLTGYWPGTCAAGSGEGKLDYLISGVLGLLAGALLFGLTYQAVFPSIVKQANLGNVTVLSLWDLNPFLVIAVFTLAVLLLFYFLEHGGKRKDKLEE